MGCSVPTLATVRFVISNIHAYSPVGRGGNNCFTWASKRYQTIHLSRFEQLSFDTVQNIFFHPLISL